VRILEAGHNAVSDAAAKIAKNAIQQMREKGFLIGPNMHD
jgi:hypothetical protein